MGKGNCCVTGQFEGLFYIDNDDLLVYSREDEEGERECRMLGELDYDELTRGDWDYDEGESYFEQEDFEEWFKDKFCKRFPSFRPVMRKHWISRYRRAIMESDLFYIALEDNEWSVAVELIQKDNDWSDHGWLRNLQGRHYQRYLDEMKRLLLYRFGSIGLYAGAWTSGRLTKEEYEAKTGRKVGA